MVDLLRLIAICTAFAFSTAVHAQTAQCYQYRVTDPNTGFNGTWAPSLGAAASQLSAHLATLSSACTNSFYRVTYSSARVEGEGVAAVVVYDRTSSSFGSSGCGGSVSSTTGTQVASLTRSLIACPVDLDSECATWAVMSGTAGSWNFNNPEVTFSGNTESRSMCMPAGVAPAGKGCSMDFERSISAQYGTEWKTSGNFYAPAAGSKSCDLNPSDSVPTTTPTTADKTCPAGQTPATGTVNGASVRYCATVDKTVSDTKTVTNTVSSGGGTSTQTTTTKTECVGQNCTTIKTVTGGGTSSVSVTTQSKSSFCEETPNSPQCSSTGDGGGGGDEQGSDGEFGGACASGFTCSGDAIQCAVAKDQHLRNCTAFDGTSPERSLYDAEKGKSGTQTGAPVALTIGPGSFNTSDALGGGSCIGDMSVTVAGASVSLPFSSICGHLAMLGNVLLAVSFLLAARIVTRG